MKILIVSQRFYPENFRINDIAKELVIRGYDVTVLTGLPNYPQGKILKDYRHGKNRTQVWEGVKIIRAKEIGRHHTYFMRALNYWSFAYFGKKKVKELDKDFDVILANELSPITGCKPAIEYKRLYGTRLVMYEMDLWPESLIAGGISKRSLIYKYYKGVSRKIYASADTILVSTRPHIDYIRNLIGKEAKVEIDYLPQYAEDIYKNVKPKDPNSKTFDLMFAGNIGKIQGCMTIMKAAELILDHKNIFFHIVGDGSELKRIKRYAKKHNLTNVIFYGSLPLEDMPEMYSKADAMIVSLVSNSFTDITLPGKVQSYMLAGKPIIACANGETAALINESKCGCVIQPGDFHTLCSEILGLRDLVLSNPYSFYENYFSQNLFFESLISNLLF